jgi:hypothetical protein
MENKMVDVTLHIDEETSPDEREGLREKLLELDGVMAANYRNSRPHLMIVEYNPEQIASQKLLQVVQNRGYHAELVGI